ncbi:GlcG/HbpS family heme-binding protein [Paracoccus siganidrum]|uniref:Heme-binding protein n=1 Tax=Paracoccus siganidrum TaxID=1276757 RepID=A0A419A6G0_9RHOB|nr:heme-binding protein [Paracoccus siganidrum]RJL14810.1 heme-binding protein [Paracoccus siganidrum]RMC29988.1 heme-binding protein [Paracoccus siganidrum]
MIRTPLLAAALLAPLAAAAQDLPTAPYLPLDLAVEAADAALGACAADGHNVSVAIVARDGATKVMLKADGSGPHTGASATGKAFTSAAMGRDTAGLAGFIASAPENAGLRDMDARMVIQAGGLPIRIGEALVGGIGVGGAPSGDLDAACATAGLTAIGAAE